MKDLIKYNDFVASIHFSADDEVFFGKILGIDDSITFEGTSISSLKKSFRDAVEDYVSICNETGKDPFKSYKGSFNVRIDPFLHKEAAMKSSELGVSLNQLVADAISNFVTKKGTYGYPGQPDQSSTLSKEKPGPKTKPVKSTQSK